MRKKSAVNLADTIFWYLLYFLPVIVSIAFFFLSPYLFSIFEFEVPDSLVSDFNIEFKNQIFTILFGKNPYLFSLTESVLGSGDLESLLSAYNSFTGSLAESLKWLGFVPDDTSLFGLIPYVFNRILGTTGSVFTSSPMLQWFIHCMDWFITVYIFHLFIDFLLFIPRLTHKWMNKATGGD